jgi:hypothetical protein
VVHLTLSEREFGLQPGLPLIHFSPQLSRVVHYSSSMLCGSCLSACDTPGPDQRPGASGRADSRSAQSHRTTSRVSANRPARPGTLNIGIPILPLQHACLNAPTEANPNASASADEPMSCPYRPAILASSSSTSSVVCRKSRFIWTHLEMTVFAILHHPACDARYGFGKDAFSFRLTPYDDAVTCQHR